MAYVIVSPCIDVKDGACKDVCPVDCIYEGGRMMYIHPADCIDCGLCLSVCPVDAIYAEDDTPSLQRAFVQINAEFFAPEATEGANPSDGAPRDHPLVKLWATTERSGSD